ncbi:MAG: PEP-CTERM sorting domain-containing protein, partial [Okeania sp. SIO2D1]|nr:PEP-CTERM sorting domain-containing protein [Okeania sp. SIO2D1]
CTCTNPKEDKQGNLPQNPILATLMKPISSSASALLSIFEQPAYAADVCSPCPLPESSSILSLFALGTLGAGSTLLRKKKQHKSVSEITSDTE